MIFTRSGLLTIVAIVGAGLVGLLDDWIKVSRERNLGLTKRAKMVGLLVVAVGLRRPRRLPHAGALDARRSPASTTAIEIGRWPWIVLTIFLILAATNAVNLTDGLDGLAAGSAVFGFICFTVIGFWALPPRLPARPTPSTSPSSSAAMLGGCAGFLWWNAAPARIFMGDTGSLAIGAALACLAVLTRRRSCCRSSAACS